MTGYADHMNGQDANQISTITRTAIIDEVQLSGISCYGKRDEVAFLSRIFDLDSLPTTDGRFKSMAGDIWQHRVNNFDWPDDRVFTDDRLNLMNGPNEVFLNFLSEMIHPLVRPDIGKARNSLTYSISTSRLMAGRSQRRQGSRTDRFCGAKTRAGCRPLPSLLRRI